ncbi:MAG: hypothetical protein FWF56_04350 [Firmicutes bacterium]|nr:hypothetical protein [Bacillota bacterium]MCL1954205.1 hypothetical protein [Bacillota bacterium]
MNKLTTYLGFCIKSGKIIYGIDNIISSHKLMYAILYDKSLSQNAISKAKTYAQRNSIPIIELDCLLQDILHKPNCKIVSILDKNLANAIMNCN